jgi:hypothetical protein
MSEVEAPRVIASEVVESRKKREEQDRLQNQVQRSNPARRAETVEEGHLIEV